MSALQQAVAEFFNEEQWPFSGMEDDESLRTAFEGANGRWAFFARPLEERGQVIFYSVLLENAPGERCTELNEFLTRLNFGLLTGNFELDLDDGETRYKTSLDAHGSEPNHAMIMRAVSANVLTMDKYLPGIMAVAFKGVSARDALAIVTS